MTRKDTILIAVVINAGLLAILFTTAMVYDTEKIEEKEFLTPLAADAKPLETDLPPSVVAIATTGDEVDNVLNYYTQSITPAVSFDPSSDYAATEPVPAPYNEDDHEEQIIIPADPQYVEIRVKKGDALDKLARANGTTVTEIKRINHLQNERLSIGQVLKIPVKRSSTSSANSIRKDERKENTSADGVFYVVKSGDNPWKIAKQFNVNYEDILILNNLNEEKARNMKPGDRIRVK